MDPLICREHHHYRFPLFVLGYRFARPRCGAKERWVNIRGLPPRSFQAVEPLWSRIGAGIESETEFLFQRLH